MSHSLYWKGDRVIVPPPKKNKLYNERSPFWRLKYNTFSCFFNMDFPKFYLKPSKNILRYNSFKGFKLTQPNKITKMVRLCCVYIAYPWKISFFYNTHLWTIHFLIPNFMKALSPCSELSWYKIRRRKWKSYLQWSIFQYFHRWFLYLLRL
jgi:hypothetical protein